MSDISKRSSPWNNDADLTGLLHAWSAGDRDAEDQVMGLLYPEIRRMAAYQLGRGNGSQSIQATDLANEAYLRLVKWSGVSWNDRLHFRAAIGQVLRSVVVDRARAHRRQKRQDPSLRVDFDIDLVSSGTLSFDLLVLDEVLRRLHRIDSTAARVVTLRFFGGLTGEETATVLNLGTATVFRHWRFAKSWLRDQLT